MGALKLIFSMFFITWFGNQLKGGCSPKTMMICFSILLCGFIAHSDGGK